MMRISFAAQRRDDTLIASVAGDVLTVNGSAYDFASIPEGGALPVGTVPCDMIVGPVERMNGVIHLTLVLPHGPNPPHAIAFPEPVLIDDDGVIVTPHEEADHVDA